MIINMYNSQQQAGFALLISMLVVGVVISVGLSILDLSIKQVRLSSDARESELAFHAANAGMECARYWRRDEAALVENGQAMTPSCFGVSAGAVTPSNLAANVTGDGDAYKYEYDFTWGGGTEVRCTRVNMIVASSTTNGAGITINGMDTLVAGYPASSGTSRFCEAGSRCTTVSVQGYNLPCANTGGIGAVQREVLLEF
jgi:Tfp pilus assembly protein PilX